MTVVGHANERVIAVEIETKNKQVIVLSKYASPCDSRHEEKNFLAS